MKEMLIALFLFLFLGLGNAQTVLVHSRTKTFKSIKKKTLLVVLDDSNDKYNNLMKEAFEKYWDYCKFQFISQNELGKKIDAQYNIFIPIVLDSRINKLSYEILTGVHQPKNQISFSKNGYINATRVASIETFDFAIINQIQALQDLLKYAEVKIKRTPMTNIRLKFIKPYYCNKIKKLNADTVHVHCNTCSDEVFSYLKSVFPNEIIKANPDEIEMVNTLQKENYTYMIIGQDNRFSEFTIVRAKGGEIIYKGSFMTGYNLTLHDENSTIKKIQLKKETIDSFIEDINKYLK